MTVRTPLLNDFFVFFFVLFSLNFFSATIASTGVLKNISYAYLLAAIIISFQFFFCKNRGLVLPIKIISLAIIFSIFMAYISWGQGLKYSVSTIPYLVWIFFFYLLHIQYPINKIEKIILFYGILYLLLFLFQFAHSGIVYFGFKEGFKEDRGIIRINFPGAGVFFLSYFIALNKSTQKGKLQWLYVCFLLIGFTVTVLQVTRQNIALLLLISFFHLTKKISLLQKGIVLIFFGAVVGLFLTSDNAISRGLAETQKETISAGNKYIRVLAGTYFLEDYSPNTLSRIFGNGFPNNTSNYGKFTTNLEDLYGFYLSDVGLIGFYVMFGILPIICYIIIFVKSFSIKMPEKYSYLKYYLVLLLLTCLISDSVYSINFIAANIFVFYTCHQLYKKNTAGIIKHATG